MVLSALLGFIGLMILGATGVVVFYYESYEFSKLVGTTSIYITLIVSGCLTLLAFTTLYAVGYGWTAVLAWLFWLLLLIGFLEAGATILLVYFVAARPHTQCPPTPCAFPSAHCPTPCAPCVRGTGHGARRDAVRYDLRAAGCHRRERRALQGRTWCTLTPCTSH